MISVTFDVCRIYGSIYAQIHGFDSYQVYSKYSLHMRHYGRYCICNKIDELAVAASFFVLAG